MKNNHYSILFHDHHMNTGIIMCGHGTDNKDIHMLNFSCNADAISHFMSDGEDDDVFTPGLPIYLEDEIEYDVAITAEDYETNIQIDPKGNATTKPQGPPSQNAVKGSKKEMPFVVMTVTEFLNHSETYLNYLGEVQVIKGHQIKVELAAKTKVKEAQELRKDDSVDAATKKQAVKEANRELKEVRNNGLEAIENVRKKYYQNEAKTKVLDLVKIKDPYILAQKITSANESEPGYIPLTLPVESNTKGDDAIVLLFDNLNTCEATLAILEAHPEYSGSGMLEVIEPVSLYDVIESVRLGAWVKDPHSLLRYLQP